MAHEVQMPDPLDSASSKSLESIKFDRDFGGHVVVREQSVPHQSVRPLSAYERGILTKQNPGYPGTLVSRDVQNERNTTQSRVVSTYFPTNDGNVVYPQRTSQRVDREILGRFADKTQTTRSYVPRNAAIGLISNRTLSIEQGLYAPDLDSREVTLADSFVDREDVETDPETGLMTKIISEVVYVLPTLSEQAAGTNVTYREVATGVWIKETRLQLGSDGAPINPASTAAFYTFTWDTTERAEFPGYHYNFPEIGYFPTTFLPQQRRTVCIYRPLVRLGFSGLTDVEYTETRHAMRPPLPPNIRNLNGINWSHDGMLVSFNYSNILQDDPNTTYHDVVALPGDTYYGTYVERVRTNAATPVPANIYRNSYKGTMQAVSAEIRRGPNKTFIMLLKRVRLQ